MAVTTNQHLLNLIPELLVADRSLVIQIHPIHLLRHPITLVWRVIAILTRLDVANAGMTSSALEIYVVQLQAGQVDRNATLAARTQIMTTQIAPQRAGQTPGQVEDDMRQIFTLSYR